MPKLHPPLPLLPVRRRRDRPEKRKAQACVRPSARVGCCGSLGRLSVAPLLAGSSPQRGFCSPGRPAAARSVASWLSTARSSGGDSTRPITASILVSSHPGCPRGVQTSSERAGILPTLLHSVLERCCEAPPLPFDPCRLTAQEAAWSD